MAVNEVSVKGTFIVGQGLDADVTTLRGREALIQLLPSGLAWVFEPGANMHRMATALAKCFGRVDFIERHMVRQLDPSTADYGIAQWEQILGLAAGDLGLAERRVAVLGALRARGGQSAAYWKAFLEDLGYTNVVVSSLENRLRSGDRIRKRAQGNGWAFALLISADSIPALDAQMQAAVLAAKRATLYIHFELS